MSNPIVYLIDDEPEILEFLSTAVELAGLHPKSYDRASTFFETNVDAAPGSILILDLNMPEMDGIEVMRRLTKLANPPKLILISGHDFGVLHAAEQLGQAHNLEIIATLNKPVPFQELRKILNENSELSPVKQRRKPKIVDRGFSAGELHTAIKENQLILHFQPQIMIKSGEYSGFEALVRWQHPEKGLIFPDLFIPLAEQNGLIGELTAKVIESAVEQQQLLQEKNLNSDVSVNISSEDITSLTLPEQLARLLESRQLDPGLLTLEITESALMGELITSLDILTRLRLKGLRLSIDDFGTGYSSLSQLHRVPFTELKIDRSFVINMVADEQARAIVKTCIMLGHELGMQVVAEGVETKEHLDILSNLGCDIAQGYYISRPVPAEVLEKILQDRFFTP